MMTEGRQFFASSMRAEGRQFTTDSDDAASLSSRISVAPGLAMRAFFLALLNALPGRRSTHDNANARGDGRVRERWQWHDTRAGAT
ncbi:hypothetical protein FWG76_02690 [Candidatus Saccharibacteria bacterium]|nr:hypothetical protein [Candidatus Saccharibacteria bacterium]